eukprot:Skav225505  [mRNA]  locus=scaffold1721:240506:247539:- [translate_table: standard]
MVTVGHGTTWERCIVNVYVFTVGHTDWEQRINHGYAIAVGLCGSAGSYILVYVGSQSGGADRQRATSLPKRTQSGDAEDDSCSSMSMTSQSGVVTQGSSTTKNLHMRSKRAGTSNDNHEPVGEDTRDDRSSRGEKKKNEWNEFQKSFKGGLEGLMEQVEQLGRWRLRLRLEEVFRVVEQLAAGAAWPGATRGNRAVEDDWLFDDKDKKESNRSSDPPEKEKGTDGEAAEKPKGAEAGGDQSDDGERAKQIRTGERARSEDHEDD